MILLIITLIILCAIFSGAETALISLSKVKVAGMIRQKLPGAKAVHKLKEHPRRFIITILIGNSVATVYASALATVYTIELFGSIGIGIVTGIMTILLLVIGDVIPKSLAIVHAESFSLVLAPPLIVLEYLLFPIVRPLEWMVNLIARRKPQLMTEAEFLGLIDAGAKDNVIEPQEAELIEDILKFNDIKVKSLMTPRSKVFALPGSMPLRKAIPLLQKNRYARIPLIERSKDNVIGVLLLKDAFEVIGKGNGRKLKDLMLPPLFVSGERRAAGLFRDLQRRHVHLAVVVDEFGGMAGIVTLEDLMEEILGEIHEEGDKMQEPFQRITKHNVLVRGDAEIRTVNEFFHSTIPAGMFQTLNGYLAHEFTRIPRPGSVLQSKDLRFTVLESSEKQILKVRIEKV